MHAAFDDVFLHLGELALILAVFEGDGRFYLPDQDGVLLDVDAEQKLLVFQKNRYGRLRILDIAIKLDALFHHTEFSVLRIEVPNLDVTIGTVDEKHILILGQTKRFSILYLDLPLAALTRQDFLMNLLEDIHASNSANLRLLFLFIIVSVVQLLHLVNIDDDNFIGVDRDYLVVRLPYYKLLANGLKPLRQLKYAAAT